MLERLGRRRSAVSKWLSTVAGDTSASAAIAWIVAARKPSRAYTAHAARTIRSRVSAAAAARSFMS